VFWSALRGGWMGFIWGEGEGGGDALEAMEHERVVYPAETSRFYFEYSPSAENPGC